MFALFLDDYHLEKEQRTTLRVRAALQNWVRGFGANDLVTVMDPLLPLSALQWTRSFDEVRRRIDTVEGRLYQLVPVRSVMEEAQNTRPNVWEIRGAVTLSALESLVTYLGGLGEGRKSVLFVSQGPSMGDYGLGNQPRLRSVIEAANRGNVTIHVFDPRVLGAAPVGGADSLAQLARETGGRVVANINDPTEGLAQTLADASGYYLLGYTPARPAADGRFHRIEVKVKRRGVDVRARRGYWAPTAADRTPATAPPVDGGVQAAMAALAPQMGGQTVDVWLGASKTADGLTVLTMTWERAPGITGPVPARVEMEPIVAGTPARRPDEPLPPDAQAIGQDARARFVLTPGTQSTFRWTVKAGDGAVLDQWQRTVPVPVWDAGQLALSSLRLFRARSFFEERALDSTIDAHPVAGRRFARSDRVVVEGEAYAGVEPTITADLMNPAGQRLSELPVTNRRSGLFRVNVPLASLASGAYIVRVRGSAAGQVAEQLVALRVN